MGKLLTPLTSSNLKIHQLARDLLWVTYVRWLLTHPFGFGTVCYGWVITHIMYFVMYSLSQAMLGYELRKNGNSHNCEDDACAAMKLVLARLEGKISDVITQEVTWKRKFKTICTWKCFFNTVVVLGERSGKGKVADGCGKVACA